MNFLTARWSNLIMANYLIDREILMPYLPAGTELDLYKEKAVVSLVGFMFLNTRIFACPIPGFRNFEEINLRFYVTRREGGQIRRGVVFINETVPYAPVAWVANRLFREHYTVVPTCHQWEMMGTQNHITYRWKYSGKWNAIGVKANAESYPMSAGSVEEFIFEHYYGYTRINERQTEEYSIKHPRWLVYPVLSYFIECDFGDVYGRNFGILNHIKPDSVLLAEGSAVAVDWRRRRF
jgi:uncharacterized protein